MISPRESTKPYILPSETTKPGKIVKPGETREPCEPSKNSNWENMLKKESVFQPMTSWTDEHLL